MSAPEPELEQAIPARRLAPKDHLQRAARASLGSYDERYHLDAAQAEALLRIADRLFAIEVHLDRLNRIGPAIDALVVTIAERSDP